MFSVIVLGDQDYKGRVAITDPQPERQTPEKEHWALVWREGWEQRTQCSDLRAGFYSNTETFVTGGQR